MEITALPPLHLAKTTLLVDDPGTILAQPDNEPIGPETFFVSGDTITVQDRINDVLGIYRDGRRVDTIKIPPIQCCTDMLIQGDRYWLLDSEHTLYEYRRQPGAHRLTEINHYNIDDDQPTSVQAEGENIVVQTVSGTRILAAGPGPIQFTPIHILKHGWTIDSGTVQVKLVVRWEPWDIDLLTRTADSSYYRVWDIKPGSDLGDEVPNDGYLYEISNTGQLLRTFTMKNHGDVVPNRDVVVATDGNVYQMIKTGKTTRIYRIEPNP